MTDIEKTLAELVESLEAPVDRDKVKAAWKEYSALWPDLARAMYFLQAALVRKTAKSHDKEATIKLGQYMENLRWSIKK